MKKNTTKNKERKSSVLAPYLILKSLNGDQTNFTISNDKLLIGRMQDINDISLQPDPQNLVTRHMHCFIEIRNSTGWLIDNASKNGTFLKRNNAMQKITGEIKLQDNDCIMILGEIINEDSVNYWELTYKDPLATKNIVKKQTTIVYDWIQAKLIINIDGKQEIVNSLTPLEHKLLRFMDQKNKQNNDVPVMCTYEELISALWDDIYSHTPNDVNHIVAALRKKIEKDYKNPLILINIRGLGYRFITNQ
jgi:pSer/pThr/pTyr-binding forkhead associated (FHA) protein